MPHNTLFVSWGFFFLSLNLLSPEYFMSPQPLYASATLQNMWKFQRNYVNHMAYSVEGCFHCFCFCLREEVMVMVKEERQILPCYHYWYHALYSRLPNVQSGLLLSEPRVDLLSILNTSGRREKTLLCQELLRPHNAELLEGITPS